MTVARTSSPARRTGGDRLTPLELGAWREFLRVHATLTRELDEELRPTDRDIVASGPRSPTAGEEAPARLD
jgi:hypothetical protein